MFDRATSDFALLSDGKPNLPQLTIVLGSGTLVLDRYPIDLAKAEFAVGDR
jgi:hypothetical protein